MIAPIELTHEVDQPPAACLICNGRPTKEGDEPGTLPPMIHVPGMDVNWGESVYFCHECVNVMAQLMGHVSAEDAEELQKENKRVKRENKKLTVELRNATARARRIADGKRAEMELV